MRFSDLLNWHLSPLYRASHSHEIPELLTEHRPRPLQVKSVHSSLTQHFLKAYHKEAILREFTSHLLLPRALK